MLNQPSGAAVMKIGVSKGPTPKKQQTKTNKQIKNENKNKKNQKVATETDSSKFTTKKTFVVAPYVQGSQKK